MQLFIKILVISFPVAFGLALFWQVPELQQIQARRMAETVPARAASVNGVQETPSSNIGISEEACGEKGPSGIFRWEDENGRVIFSDRPGDATAVQHTPGEIGHYQVSPIIRQRIERDSPQ